MIKKIVSFVVIFVLAVWLRAPFSATVPVSPYWEETILGYDAYSLSQTGKDHHGTSWPIVALESFGDWKPTGYVYALLPFVKVLGLELWVVRLPSLLAGLAIIGAVAVLARRLGLPAWVGAFIVAVSPWGVHFSRAAWEAHLATALIAWAMIFALKAITIKKLQLWPTIVSIFLFAFSWYTYHSARVVVPLLVVGLVVYALAVLHRASIEKTSLFLSFLVTYCKRSWLSLLAAFVLLVVAVSPLVISPSANSLTHRFAETGRFSDPAVVIASNELKDMAGNTLISRLAYHRYVLWTANVLTSYFDNLNPAFLFVSGESNIRHTTSFFGLFYPFESVFFLIGIYFWLKKRTPLHWLLAYWLLVSIVPAALAIPTPHALRIMIGLPVFALLITEGFVVIVQWLTSLFSYKRLPVLLSKHSQNIAITCMVVLYVVGVSAFWFNYTQVYAVTSARQWQYGYEEMYQKLAAVEAEFPELPVYISRFDGRPAAYLWFYRYTDPQLVQQENGSALKDQGEFLTFQKYHFVRSASEIPDGPALIALSKEDLANYQKSHTISQISEVSDHLGNTVWMIGKQ